MLLGCDVGARSFSTVDSGGGRKESRDWVEGRKTSRSDWSGFCRSGKVKTR